MLRLVAVCALLALARADEEKYLISIPNTPEPNEVSNQLLEAGFDVRGVYSDLVVVVGSGAVISRLEHKYPLVDEVGRYTPTIRSYYVIMRTLLESDTVHTSGEWNVAMREALTGMDSVTIMNSPVADRIFVSVPFNSDSELMGGLLFNAEILQILPQTIMPPAKFDMPRQARQSQDIANLVAQVSQDTFRTYANDITGASSTLDLETRNSYSISNPKGILLATDYIQGFLERLGWKTEIQPFRTGFGPNIIAIWPGQTDEVVILGAHYDSRGPSRNSPTQVAPGANDDGSGTVALMEIARVISQAQARFRASIHLNFYCGEEQGLVGSGALAQRYLEDKTNVIAMIQADMIAYRLTGPNQLGIALDAADEALVQRIISITNNYVPGLVVGRTAACCSDQRSFFTRGFSTAQFFENAGPIQDTQYHRSGDVVDRPGYNFEQFELNLKAFLASGAELAGLL